MREALIVDVIAQIIRQQGRHGAGHLAEEIMNELDREGLAIVPKEPTTEMLAAAARNNHPRDAETWKTMLEAAPS